MQHEVYVYMCVVYVLVTPKLFSAIHPIHRYEDSQNRRQQNPLAALTGKLMWRDGTGSGMDAFVRDRLGQIDNPLFRWLGSVCRVLTQVLSDRNLTATAD